MALRTILSDVVILYPVDMPEISEEYIRPGGSDDAGQPLRFTYMDELALWNRVVATFQSASLLAAEFSEFDGDRENVHLRVSIAKLREDFVPALEALNTGDKSPAETLYNQMRAVISKWDKETGSRIDGNEKMAREVVHMMLLSKPYGVLEAIVTRDGPVAYGDNDDDRPTHVLAPGVPLPDMSDRGGEPLGRLSA